MAINTTAGGNEGKFGWSQAEDAILRENYPKAVEKAASLLPSREGRCQERTHLLKAEGVQSESWTPSEDNALKAHYPVAGEDVARLLLGQGRA